MVNRLNLMAHCGTQGTTRELLAGVDTPPGSQSWNPIPHHVLVGGVIGSLERGGLSVVTESHVVTPDGSKYFGMFQVDDGNEGDHGLVVGLRNSHDKTFGAGIVAGDGCFVCDNLCFTGEIKIGRRHTRFIERDLPQLISRAVGGLGKLRQNQEARFAAYREYELTDPRAHDLVIQALDARVIPPSRVPKVLKEWRTPRHPEFVQAGKTAYRLMNAFTEVAKASNVMERPKQTIALQGVLDTTVGIGGL